MEATQRSPASQFNGFLLPPDFFEMTMDPSTVTTDVTKQSEVTPSTPAIQTVYQTPPRNVVSVVKTPAAPKRQPKKRKTTKTETGLERYALWPLDALQLEFMRRFSPLSQKRLNDRSFMVLWLEAEDEQQRETSMDGDSERNPLKVSICLRCLRIKNLCICGKS